MMNLAQAEYVAAELVSAGFAARTYPSDRQVGGHMVSVKFGRQRYRVYEVGGLATALASFAGGVFTDEQPEEGGGVNGTQGPV